MNHPTTLTDDDLQTILDGCYTERMELVARIRGPPGVCEHGKEPVTIGECRPYVECSLKYGECEYQACGGWLILCTREAAAQSFPKDYIFTGNQVDVVKQIGNAVCPKVAEALTSAYMRELAGGAA